MVKSRKHGQCKCKVSKFKEKVVLVIFNLNTSFALRNLIFFNKRLVLWRRQPRYFERFKGKYLRKILLPLFLLRDKFLYFLFSFSVAGSISYLFSFWCKFFFPYYPLCSLNSLFSSLLWVSWIVSSLRGNLVVFLPRSWIRIGSPYVFSWNYS